MRLLLEPNTSHMRLCGSYMSTSLINVITVCQMSGLRKKVQMPWLHELIFKAISRALNMNVLDRHYVQDFFLLWSKSVTVLLVLLSLKKLIKYSEKFRVITLEKRNRHLVLMLAGLRYPFLRLLWILKWLLRKF